MQGANGNFEARMCSAYMFMLSSTCKGSREGRLVITREGVRDQQSSNSADSRRHFRFPVLSKVPLDQVVKVWFVCSVFTCLGDLAALCNRVNGTLVIGEAMKSIHLGSRFWFC